MDNNQIYEKMTLFQSLLRQQARQQHQKSVSAWSQERILAVLKLQSEISVSDLSYLLGMRNRLLMRLLSKLEEGGYVTLAKEPEEDFAKIVAITEKGIQAQGLLDDSKSTVFDCLSDEEKEAFTGLFERMLEDLGKKTETSNEDETHGQWRHGKYNRRNWDRGHGKRGYYGHGYHHGRSIRHWVDVETPEVETQEDAPDNKQNN
ncbi:MAG: MarR family winged helix-turn-helix transcriptional regulator [Eubacteriaceae bacterium]|nr:MarR family winged helix-turn-helix transcriptional regulator [Eubacteriaceae bacterium]